jgi:hypothetical protein
LGIEEGSVIGNGSKGEVMGLLEGVAGNGMSGDGAGGKCSDKQPSSCGICLFLISSTTLLLAHVASLYVFHVAVAEVQAV